MKNQKAKEKGIAFKDTDDYARPIRSITTLQPLPTIDPKDKERERQEEASNATLAEIYDEVQAQIDADHELIVRLIHEEQEKYTVEERSKFGWPFVYANLGHVAHLVASIILDSARSFVIQGAFLTKGMVSSIPTVLRWGNSIRPKGFLSSVLLWLVIIVAVVSGGVTVVVESSSVIKFHL
nr:hypothetical protein [Tanacetum cinerariifolium]